MLLKWREIRLSELSLPLCEVSFIPILEWLFTISCIRLANEVLIGIWAGDMHILNYSIYN